MRTVRFADDAVYLVAEGIRSLKASGVSAAQIPFQPTKLMESIRNAKVNGATGLIYYPSTGAYQNDRLGNPKPWFYCYSASGLGNGGGPTTTFGIAKANFSITPSDFSQPILFPTASGTTTTNVPAFCYGGTGAQAVTTLIAGVPVQSSTCLPCVDGTYVNSSSLKCVSCPKSGVWCV